MNAMKNDITSLNVKNVLNGDKYRVPLYQRNYDWGETESLQLIEDVADYASQNSEKPYYIGSLVVFKRSNNGGDYYEVIDGQQRLTTLNILACVLKNRCNTMEYKGVNLSYDHREESDNALAMLCNGGQAYYQGESRIVEVYNILSKELNAVLESRSLTLEQFVGYLSEKVIILRISIPQETDLNHYFEIMNSRGEQLEKHEVLKARLMNHLTNTERPLFNGIWEACSDMSVYVQMKFSPDLREQIFVEDSMCLTKELFAKITSNYNEQNMRRKQSLSALIEEAKTEQKTYAGRNENVGSDRFSSIINFPNFLLQALKVFCLAHHPASDFSKELPLDDKRLLETFDKVVTEHYGGREGEFSKQFILSLLKTRYLFDQYVIKRNVQGTKDEWSLKKWKSNDKNVYYVETFPKDAEDENSELGKDILMLEAMFHVSAPTQIYKHWLNAVLWYTYENSEVTSGGLREFLYTLACSYMIYRYIGGERQDFKDFIYSNAKPTEATWSMKEENFHLGCGVENFIFNFYDYITWKAESDNKEYKDFEFTYRTSVEHFYPQTPIDGTGLDRALLDSFGNLCLISRGTNSKFSNNMPKAKVANFSKDAQLSIKLKQMMDITDKKGHWADAEIIQHGKEAIESIKNALKQ